MQGVRQHMHGGLVPGNQLAVEPDVVGCGDGHWYLVEKWWRAALNGGAAGLQGRLARRQAGAALL